MNKVALAVDLELNPIREFKADFDTRTYYEHIVWDVIEIGITEISLTERKILKKVSLPIKYDKPLKQDIINLTGWTNNKLNKAGVTFKEACDKLINKYGSKNRLIIVDRIDELEPVKKQCSLERHYKPWFEYPFSNQLFNVSDYFKIITKEFSKHYSLEEKLRLVDLEFIGKQHRGSDDSYNIARLFLKLMEKQNGN